MEKLLQPFDAKGLHFRNRIVHVATTLNMSDPQGYATRRLAAAYGAIARGGYGATMVGATCVRRDGLINERMLGLYDEDYVIEFRDVVAEIKHNDSLAGIQLFYGGLIPGLGTTVPLQPGKGWIPGTVAWGPSNRYVIGNPQSDVIPTEVYEEIVEAYGQAARRAREAGFEFVSFHFCHGSLPHTNLSLLANQGRTDKYADHFLLCEEIIQRTQQLCGKDFPIIPRLCCDENLQGGFDIEYFADNYAPRLHALGIAVLDCTFGSMLGAPSRRPDIHSTEFIGPSFYTPKVVNRENIQTLRAALQKRNIDMPLLGSANLITPDHLREMVEVAGADFAGVCRLSLDDPDFPNKIIEGREHEIRKSTHTGASLLQGNIFGKGWAGSAQNPNFGRDDEYRIRATARPRRIMVVGGGSGGMEYAITAREIGHDVTLYERSGTLGGAMDWAGNYPNLPNTEMLRYQPDYHRVMMDKLQVPRVLGVAVTPELVREVNPDVVVIATGAEAVIPDVPGLADARKAGFAFTMDEAMHRTAPASLGKRVLVFGAGEGAELAVDLKRGGHEVRLADAKPQYAPTNYIGSRVYSIMGLLAIAGIQVEGDLTLAAVAPGKVTLRAADGTEQVAEVDSLVFCCGRTPANGLAKALAGEGRVVQVIGDARTPRSYGNAIHEAAYLVRQL
jgi:2,4-dienoyl-CoA reductase-like NADH-dependent reductase (Old Yellow Enzyme family)/NADPH-dependent 2,4-dienoyl-CoA reductase/sulfur reductase-like enzyme